MTGGAPPLHLLILAGGQGLRARGGDSAAPKQFRRVAGSLLVTWSARELAAAPGVASLVVAVPEPWRAVVRTDLADLDLKCPCHLAGAGETRTGTTWEAICVLRDRVAPGADDLVAVHDAARPFADRRLLGRLAAAAAEHGAAVPGVPVADTIVALRDGDDETARAGYLERDALRALQTPQVFRWLPFLEAHQWCAGSGEAFSDDGGLLAARGLAPVVVRGEPENWKITTEADLERAEAVLLARRRRERG